MNSRSFCSLGVFSAGLLLSGLALALCLPEGYTVPDTTVSPSHRYGFTVPQLDILGNTDNVHNSLVDMKTGKVIAVINAWPGFDRMNHGGVDAPWWSHDESVVLWEVDGKWSPWALVLIRLKGGTEAWQLNVLTKFQSEILARTKAAEPKEYETAKKQNAGNGAAYPDGFTVDVEPDTGALSVNDKRPPLSLPLRIHTTLTSNPKQIADFPNLDSEMDGTVNKDGTITVTDFKLLPPPSSNER